MARNSFNSSTRINKELAKMQSRVTKIVGAGNGRCHYNEIALGVSYADGIEKIFETFNFFLDDIEKARYRRVENFDVGDN